MRKLWLCFVATFLLANFIFLDCFSLETPSVLLHYDHVVTEVIDDDVLNVPLNEMAPLYDSISSFRANLLLMNTQLHMRSNQARSCLMAGSNIVFVVDSSEATSSADLQILKKWIQKLIRSLRIADIEKVTAVKNRQAYRRKMLYRLPRIATYGVGLSIVQFANQPLLTLPLSSRPTIKQINQAIYRMKIQDGVARVGDALSFVRNKVLQSNHSSRLPTRDIVVLILSGNSSDYAALQALQMRNEGTVFFIIALKQASRDWSEDISSKPISKHYFKLSSISSINKIRSRLMNNICISSQRKKSTKVSKRSGNNQCTNCTIKKQEETAGSNKETIEQIARRVCQAIIEEEKEKLLTKNQVIDIKTEDQLDTTSPLLPTTRTQINLLSKQVDLDCGDNCA